MFGNRFLEKFLVYGGRKSYSVLAYFVVGFYGVLAFVGFLNLILMRVPKPRKVGEMPLVLIPARDESANLTRLIPALIEPNPGLRVIVFDDESSDGTADAARSAGAEVISPPQPLPAGWTGKNRACFELAREAGRSNSEWWLFLDADVHPESEFIGAMQSLCADASPSMGVITGFPHVLPGKGIEPMFLAWVGWILLTTNPYGLINRSGVGHSRFKNGQVHCWRREVYQNLQPNEKVRSKIMEDVMIGRMLASQKVGVEVANLSRVLQVRMYENWRQTFDGMSKNSYEITGSVVGSIGIALLFLFAGWGWLLAGKFLLLALALFLLGGVEVCLIARTVWWPMLLGPFIPTIGAITVLRSAVWHRKGLVKWKGRTYGHTKKGGSLEE